MLLQCPRDASTRTTVNREPVQSRYRAGSNLANITPLFNYHPKHAEGGFIDAIVHEGAHSPKARCRHCRLNVRMCALELKPNLEHESESGIGLRKRVAITECH
jgi:hypothetical protein